jgi:hypothetical protein
MTIEAQWQALETEARGINDSAWRLRLARPVGGHPLFVAVSGGRRVLLLRVDGTSIPPRTDWPVCTGLEVLAVTLDGHAYFGVALREPRFADVFAALAEDLARRIEDAPSGGFLRAQRKDSTRRPNAGCGGSFIFCKRGCCRYSAVPR